MGGFRLGYDSGMIIVTDKIILVEDEIQLDYVRASGPGGQKINKTASAVQLRFNVLNSPALTEDVRARLIKLAGKRITEHGELIIRANRYRTQEENRQDAINRLVSLVQEAAVVPKKRKKTKPTEASRKRRLDAKKRRSEKKQLRKRVGTADD